MVSDSLASKLGITNKSSTINVKIGSDSNDEISIANHTKTVQSKNVI